MEQAGKLKWTKQRKRVREILEAAAEPMNATQIFMALTKEEQEQYALSTVYRILATFEEHELVTKSAWMDEQTYVYEWNQGQHKHYAVCLECHKRIALEHCPFSHVALEQETDNFVITSHKLELYGYCKSCSTKHGA